MEIVSTRVIRPKNRESNALANVEITFDTGIVLLNMHLLRPREEGGGYFLQMPTIQAQNGRYMEVFHPITKETRKKMTEAAIEALRQAEEAGVNDFTVTFKEIDETNLRAPEYSDIRVHWFDNDKAVRAFVSLLMDGEIVLNRMAIVRDADTKMLALRIPTRLLRNRWKIGYYKIYGNAYDLLYNQVLDAYSNRPTAD